MTHSPAAAVWRRYALPGLLLWLTFAIYLTQFPHHPPAFAADEAYNALDARWLAETGALVADLPGNNGRGPLFHYLLALSMHLFGPSVFAVRFVPLAIGLLSVALMWRFVTTLFHDHPHRTWLALLAAAVFATAFWHITLSRVAFRAVFIPFFYLLMSYAFWRGWQTGRRHYFVLAGVALGLSQYTYFLARVFPLIFGLFGGWWLLTARRKAAAKPSLRQLWLGIGLMAVSSAVVFVPLGLEFARNPNAFYGYILDSSVAAENAPNRINLAAHVWDSLRIVFDGPVGLWQGRPVPGFDWVAWLGFWLGLGVSVWRSRRPVYAYLLISLFVAWLPAILNDMDFSALRLPAMIPVTLAIGYLRMTAVLPIYMLLAALGWFTLGQGLATMLRSFGAAAMLRWAVPLLLLLSSAAINLDSFFRRWPQEALIFERYSGPAFELAQDLLAATPERDLLIPFALYNQTTVRFFLAPHFTEVDMPPPTVDRPARLVTLDRAPADAYVWLQPNLTQPNAPGRAYVTPVLSNTVLQAAAATELAPFLLTVPLPSRGQRWNLDTLSSLQPQLAAWPPLDQLNLQLGAEDRLLAYELIADAARPGETVQLNLYWQNLIDQPLEKDIFIHLLNAQGEGVTQIDGLVQVDGQRWRAGKLLPQAYFLRLPPDLPPGPYLFRVGLFDALTGRREPVFGPDAMLRGDEIRLGLFHITPTGEALPPPLVTQSATLGDEIRLQGYSPALPDPAATELSLTLFWQALRRPQTDYTIFLQVLDGQNQRLSGFDAQPLGQVYPTSFWPAGEQIRHTMPVSLPPDAPPGSYRLVGGMYDFQTGQRLPVLQADGQAAADAMLPLLILERDTAGHWSWQSIQPNGVAP